MYNQSNYGNKRSSKELSSQLKMAQFTFVDLAGSEKLDSEKDIDRINEAKYINKSLSALGHVIQALKNK